jgi:hypothetical protein
MLMLAVILLRYLVLMTLMPRRVMLAQNHQRVSRHEQRGQSCALQTPHARSSFISKIQGFLQFTMVPSLV